MIKILLIHAPFFGVKHDFLSHFLGPAQVRAIPGRIEEGQFLRCDLFFLQFDSNSKLLIVDIANDLEYTYILRELYKEADAIINFPEVKFASRDEEELINKLEKVPVLKFDLVGLDQLVKDKRNWEEKEEEWRIEIGRIFEKARQFLVANINIDIGERAIRLNEIPKSFDRLRSFDLINLKFASFSEDRLTQSLKAVLKARRAIK